MTELGRHVVRLETRLAEAIVVAGRSVRRAVAEAAAWAPEAAALDLGFAVGLLAAALDRPVMERDPRDPAMIAGLYRAHVALQGDVYVLLAEGNGATCADLLNLWERENDSYFIRD